jgi:hypothetical protein
MFTNNAGRTKQIGLLIAAALMVVGCGGDSSGPIPEESTYKVFGVVRNGFAEPIAGANVNLGSRSTATNTSGAFEFIGVASGEYAVNVQKSGYTSQTWPDLVVQLADVDASCTLRKSWTFDIVARDAFVNRTYYSYTNQFTNVDQNFGSSPSLQIGDWTQTTGGGTQSYTYWYSTFIGFDFAAIPTGCVLQSAEFSITRTDVAPISIDFAQVLGPWDEYLITYNNMPSSQATSLLPVDVAMAANQSVLTIVLTSYVDSVLRGVQFRHGVFLSGDRCNFASRENQSMAHPRLSVTFVF